MRPHIVSTLARATATALGAALLVACAPLPVVPTPVEAGVPPGFPDSYYRNAARSGNAIFAIDPAASLVTIVVHRGGTLVRLGHDHVVAIRDAHGLVDKTAERADLYARLDRMTVDEPRLRRELHFDTQPSAADIEGTRTNMLERVLHGEQHPFVAVAVRRVAGAPSGSTANSAAGMHVSITLNGVTRVVPLDMTVTARGDVLEVSGSFSIDQSDFGLRPMSLFGGAITVEDRLGLRFDVRARRQGVPLGAAGHRGAG